LVTDASFLSVLSHFLGPSKLLDVEEAMTMDNVITKRNGTRPAITLSADDYERLSVLANAASKRTPELADELADEIGRARVLAKGEPARHSVRMNSEVEFRDDTAGKVQTVTLVYPDEADISKRRISVLTPIGTALIGLSSGDSIMWETPGGEVRQLTVLSVRESEAG
jgi:regulator of nucleoside diphosphate kinase